MKNLLDRIAEYKYDFYDIRVVFCLNMYTEATRKTFYDTFEEHWLRSLIKNGNTRVISEAQLEELSLADGKKNLAHWLSVSLAYKMPVIPSETAAEIAEEFFSLFNNPLVFTNHTPYKVSDDNLSWGYGSSPVSNSSMDVLIGAVDKNMVGFIVIMDED